MGRRSSIFLTAAIALIVAFALPRSATAQYPFGKNKVNYTKKEWKVMKTNHVDIYYYPNEHNIVAFVAPLVEKTYLEFEEKFDMQFRDRLPLVFYSSHYDFQQTNIVPSLISDATGGFTDLVKGRIAIPMTGSLWELRHVIRHEMVHAFMLEKLAIVMMGKNRFNYASPPLWFVEGIAEYFASPKGDTRQHMFVRDALMHGHLLDLQNIWRIEGSYMMYKHGEAIVRYIGTSYGDDALVQLLENWWVSDKFEIVLYYTLGVSVGELNDSFMASIKRRYYPKILHASFAAEQGKQLTPDRSFHARPTAALDGSGQISVSALGAQDGVINVFGMRPRGDGKLRRETLVEGSRSADFESIPAFRSKIEQRGDMLLFVAKRHARDAIYLWDVRKKKQIAHYTFPGLSLIASPTLSPEQQRIVFSAIDSTGQMDLFLYDRADEVLVRLTDDPFTEEDPDFHPSRELVVFSSDRCENGRHEYQGIYMFNLVSQDIEPLTCGLHSDAHPDWAPDGESFLFTSDRDGIFNIYKYDLDDRVVVRQTSVLGGVTTPCYMPDQASFIASCYYAGEYHLFEFPVKDAGDGLNVEVAVASVDTSRHRWLNTPPTKVTYSTEPYKQKLGLDFAGAGISLDPDFGSVGNGGALVFSDILGNHQYALFFGNTSDVSGNFFRRMNFGVNYTNLTRRLAYSVGAFHLNGITGDFFTVFRLERRIGVSAGLSYPFSRFNRVDGSVVLRFVERQLDFGLPSNMEAFLGSVYLTYVSDNTLWTIGGPLKGWRYYLTLGQTVDFDNEGFDNTTIQFDLRKYLKITNRIVTAHRFQTRHSFGSDFQIFYIGGPWDLRGYDFREFAGRSTYLINNEIRFPLIDRFNLALPIGAVEFPLIRGSLFLDMGRANRHIFDTEWLGSFGIGTELNLGYAPVIRVNFTRATDFRTISPNTDFELFIGYNY